MFDVLVREFVLIDTCAIVALRFTNDQHHEDAKAILELLKEEGARLFVTSATLQETYTRIRYDSDWQTAINIFKFINESFSPQHLSWKDEYHDHTIDLLKTQAQAKLSFHDALCACYMIDNKIARVFTFDSHFRYIGFETVP